MSFAGVSVFSRGQLLGSYSKRPAIDAGAADGYHLLVVERHSLIGNPVPGSSRKSHSFRVGGHSWCIFYYPGGSNSENSDFISLRLCLAEYPVDPVKAQFEFSFQEKQEPARIHCNKLFEFRGCTLHGNDRFVSRDELEKSRHLNGDSYTIRCDIAVAKEDVTTPYYIDVPPSEMKQNFSDLLLAGEGTDVVFQVGGETFAAHRCVLAARSAVFKASLFGPMKEGSSSASTVVQIQDMDAAVFKALLGFIYGDSLPPPPAPEEQEDSVLFQHLLVAADRYDLRRLKAMCEKKLREHISVSTTTSILALAEQHRCSGLKEACYEFLRCPANLKAVVAMDGFDHLCTSCPAAMKGLVVAVGTLHAPPK